MNIWIFNHYAVGPNSSGGTRHYDLSKELVKKGHSVTIFASSFNHQMLREEHLLQSRSKYKESNYDGVKFIWIKTTPYKKNDHRRVSNMLSYSDKALKIAKRQSEQPDIVIGSLVHPFAAYTGYRVAKHFNSIFYFEERDLWPQTLIDLGKLSEKNPMIFVLGKMESFLFNKAKRTIVLFDKAVGYVESKGIAREKVLYLPNGFDTGRTANALSPASEVSSVFDQLSNQTVAIYTGAHGKANNLDVILNAAKTIRKKEIPVSFVLIGNGPEKERLMKRAFDENIQNVYFLDPVKKEMIPELLKRADVGLLPLSNSPVFKWGISPNKLFDYMGASLPVLLLCDLDGTPVELANGGKVIKNNFEEEMVAFFETTEKDDLIKLGANAREYVEENHAWEKLALKLEEKMTEDLHTKSM
ncbi:glycosyltransferase family 4 protein [Virgibacillus sediminis]|uniref:Glycosyltransferase family 4 protein n=1 Tax=Virgibacillus sediminis TaxID=202260 RepID=A0ABV7A486_9BACI